MTQIIQIVLHLVPMCHWKELDHLRCRVVSKSCLDRNYRRWMKSLAGGKDYWYLYVFVAWDSKVSMASLRLIHLRCQYSEIECKPKTVWDFDTFCKEHPASEFFKLVSILDAVQNVERVAAAARF